MVAKRLSDVSIELHVSNCIYLTIKFDKLISKITSENADLFLVGDYNINLLNYECNEGTADFVNDLYSPLYLQLINRPTRFTESTSTTIDNIISNAYDENSTA